MSKQKKIDPLRRSFGQRVRALRKRAGMSQMELGEQSGLDHTYIGGVERGERNLSIEAIGKITQGLEVEIADRVGIMVEGNLVKTFTRQELEQEDLERIYVEYISRPMEEAV